MRSIPAIGHLTRLTGDVQHILLLSEKKGGGVLDSSPRAVPCDFSLTGFPSANVLHISQQESTPNPSPLSQPYRRREVNIAISSVSWRYRICRVFAPLTIPSTANATANRQNASQHLVSTFTVLRLPSKQDLTTPFMQSHGHAAWSLPEKTCFREARPQIDVL